MPHRFLNPPGLCPTIGWTHVVESTGSRIIHISGQVSVDERGQVVGIGDLRAQTEQAFRNLQMALEAAGATFADVAMSRIFVVGLKPESVPIIREIRARYFNRDNPPASTLVGIERLVNPDWMIEIELTAIL